MDALEQKLLHLTAGGMGPPCDQPTESAYPTLWWFLTKTAWSDGTGRTTSTILVDRVPGGYRVCLQDHSLWVQKRCTCLTWTDVLPALERALNDDLVPWEPYKSYRTKQSKIFENNGKTSVQGA